MSTQVTDLPGRCLRVLLGPSSADVRTLRTATVDTSSGWLHRHWPRTESAVPVRRRPVRACLAVSPFGADRPSTPAAGGAASSRLLQHAPTPRAARRPVVDMEVGR